MPSHLFEIVLVSGREVYVGASAVQFRQNGLRVGHQDEYGEV